MRRKIWKKVCFTILMITALLMTGCAGKHAKEQMELSEVGTEETEEISDETVDTGGVQEEESLDADNIYVHVCGEVASPGVYTLRAGSRIYEAIQAAGGLTEEAAGESLNQAAEAEDGQQIYVPSKEEVIQGRTAQADQKEAAWSTGIQNQDDGKVDLNTASKEQLMTLNGIGEAKAAAIIQYREEHGGFQHTEELMEVEGIKEGTYNKIKDQIKI